MSVADLSSREVFIVDDDPTARELLATLLEHAGFDVTRFADGASVLNEARARTPACILLDLHLPGSSGLDILAALDAKRYPAPILVVSGHSDVPGVVEAIKRGAFDYIEKQRIGDSLVARVREAVQAVAQRPANYGSAEAARAVFPGSTSLTPREHEVLAQIVDSASNKEAAARLGISRRTVEIHRAHIMQKLGAKNSVDLMRIVLGTPAEANSGRLTA
ncbi:MAG TPA: response regulator [Xanthobacteraceae bacterium]|nr:response regulator [Xanthobacteraceae bacterium]